jgi:hypothetical protein
MDEKKYTKKPSRKLGKNKKLLQIKSLPAEEDEKNNYSP